MKPAAFAYRAPRDLDEALALLAEHGDDAKPLAGGQSLVPMMNYRLVRPAVLVDLNRIAGLGALYAGPAVLRIGALVRTAQLARDPLVASGWPLLRAAALHVGHAAIRNRGTVCGSLAHADPHAELPAALLALDAILHLRSVRGSRALPAAEFFTDFYTTALEPDELLVEVEVPMPPPGAHGFAEFTRTHGDFALAGAAVQLALDPNGRCTHAAIGIFGGGATPLRARGAETAVRGGLLDAAAIQGASAEAASACDPPEPAEYRRALVAEMTRRALGAAARGAR